MSKCTHMLRLRKELQQVFVLVAVKSSLVFLDEISEGTEAVSDLTLVESELSDVMGKTFVQVDSGHGGVGSGFRYECLLLIVVEHGLRVQILPTQLLLCLIQLLLLLVHCAILCLSETLPLAEDALEDWRPCYGQWVLLAVRDFGSHEVGCAAIDQLL